MIHKYKKGFTLVELLAVIVILAVIALIAVPITLNIIEDSQKSSIKTSTTHYINVLEEELTYEILEENMESEGMYIIQNDGSFIANGEVKKLSMKGSLPSSGTICVDEKGTIESYSVVIDGYVVTKIGEEQQIEEGTEKKRLTCDVSEEFVEIEIPLNETVCSQNKKVTIKYPEYEGTEKEYSFDNKNWLEYQKPVIVEDNGTLYARLRKGNNTSSLTTISFTTIDKTVVTTEEPSVMLSTEKPTSEIIASFNQTDNCGLDERTIMYGISEKQDGEYKYQKEKIFKGLKNNTTYYVRTKANDIAGNGIIESEISTIKTENFKGITITPSTTEWKPSKTVAISGTTTGSELQYKVVNGTTIKTNWTKYEKEITIDWISTTETPTYIYARFSDGTNYSNEETLTITTVDTSVPELELDEASTTTKSITIPIITNKDLESGIKSTTCKYGEEKGSYTKTGTISNGKCTISNVKNAKDYYYQVITTNNAGLSTTKTGNTTTEDFKEITITINSTEWKPSKKVTISGTTNGSELQYKIVSGSTVKTEWTAYSNAVTIDWAANTSVPTYVYARFYDGVNYSNQQTLTVTTVDVTAASTTAPSVAASTTNPTKAVVLTIKQTDSESGISSKEYGYSTTETGTYTWGTSSTISGLTQGGTYYFKTRVKNGAGTGWTESVATQYKPDPITPCSIAMNTTAWAASKTATITGSQTGVTLQYKVVSGTTEKVAWTTISSGKTQTINWAANTTTPTYVYCRMTDGTSTINGTTYTETKVDTTAASTTVPTIAASTTNPTKAAVITNKQTDGESGISSVQYGYSTASNGTYTWGTSSTISGLTQGQTYYFKTRVKNGAGTGWTETAAVPYGPSKITDCLVSMNTTGWATSKTATITGSQTGVTLQYKVVSGTTEKVAWTTISSGKTQTINWAANTTTPTYVYCRMTDGTSTVNGTTYTETKVDITAANTTAPTSVASTTNPTKAAVITNKQADSESGISSIQYGYSTTETGTYTWGTSSTISGLTQGGTYYLKTRVKNGAGTGWTESASVLHSVPSMTPCSITMSSAGKWAASKTATITGSQTGVTLQYRIVSGTTEKVAWTTVSSGKTQTINWAANTTTPTYVYCRMTDGTNTINGTTYTETTVDTTAASTTAPTVAASTTNPTKAAVVTIKQADSESGISSIQYGYSTSSTGTYTWETSSTISGLTQGGTYYFKTRVKNGAGTGWTESSATSYKVTAMTNCSISMSNAGVWKPSKVATITGSQTGVTLQYRVVSGTTEKVAWTTVSSGATKTIDWEANTTTPTYVYCRMTDGTSTINGTTYTETTIDRTAPGTASSTIRIGSSTGTIRANTTAFTNQTLWWGSFTATDNGGSGVSYYQYSTGCTGSPSNTLSASYTYSSNTNYTFCIRAVDAAGNAGAWSGAYYIKIDKTAPPTPSSVLRYGSSTGTVRTNANSWTNQTLWWGSFSSTDTGGSGTSYYQYSSGCSGTASGTLSSSYTYSSTTNGTYCIRAVDAAGNASAWSSAYYIKVDKTAPALSNISNSSGSAWTKSNVTISCTPSDAHSGVNRVVYSYNQSTELTDISTTGGTWSADRNNSVYLKIYDNAGNASGWYSAGAVKIDKTAPSVPTITNSSGGSWTSGSVVITASSTDTGSGVSSITYSYDQANWYSDWDKALESITNGKKATGTWSAKRNNTAYFRACDALGNCSGYSSTAIKIGTYSASSACGSYSCTSYTSCSGGGTTCDSGKVMVSTSYCSGAGSTCCCRKTTSTCYYECWHT